MRLSWPFNVFQRKPSESAAAAAVPASAVETARRPGGRNEWRRLPALIETIGPPPLVAPNAPFAADLGAGSPPPPMLRPLAHGRGLDAPAGIVVGLVRPVQRAADGSARPLVQRRPMTAVSPIAEASPDAATVDPPASPPAESPVKPAPLTIVPPRARPSLARLSPRDEATLPLPKPGLVGQPDGGAVPSPRTARAPEPSRPEPAATANLAQPDGAVSRKPADAPANPELPVRARPTLGQSRRLGLGAPLATAPTASVPPAAGPRDAPPPPAVADASARPTVPMAAPEPRQLLEPRHLLELRRPETAQRLPDEIPASPPSAAMAPPTVRRQPIAAPRPEHAQTPPTAPFVPLVPARTIGARVQRAPIRGGVPVQRRARAETDEPLPAAAPQSVRVHRGANAGEMAQALEAKAFTHNGEVYLPPSAGPMGSSTARSLLAHELTHVAQQRAYGSRLPSESSAIGQRLERAAVAAERRAQLPLAMPAEPSGAEPSAPAADLAATAQRRPSAASGAHAADETTTIEFPGAQRAPATSRGGNISDATVPRTPPRAPSEWELEELASQLYGRISRRLRRELLVDRERAGLMVDLP